MEDIHDIHGPMMVGMPPDTVRLLGLALAILALVALLFLLIRRYLKARKNKTTDAVLPQIAPYDAAMKALDRLGVTPPSAPKAFYFDLSALFKAYIGASFRIHASEMTTPELVKELRTTKLDRDLTKQISRFQTLSDPFRYAPVAPDASRMASDLDIVRQLVRDIETDVKKREAKDSQQGDAA